MLPDTRLRHALILLLITLAALISRLFDPPMALQAAPLGNLDATSVDPDEEIVYIDNAGFIRVLDTRQTGTNPEVKWVSPVGGWRDFALGDFTTDKAGQPDKDLEIVAIGGGSTDGKLVVYDPVVASGVVSDPNQKTNGIPWDTLYVTDTLGSPQLVAVGEFDANLPGSEIVYTYEMRPGDKEKSTDRQRLVVLKANSATPTGRGWQLHLTAKFEEGWEHIAVGNLDNATATDEVALASEDDQILNVFRLEGGWRKIYDYGSDSKPPKAIAIGQWEENGRAELAFTRDNAAPLPSLYVQRYEGDNDFKDNFTAVFEPSPRFAFFANLNSNKDEELVMLRSVSEEFNLARMVVRGRNQKDIPAELDHALDKDNGYRAGTGGDIDADGKDEIILIRDNKLIIFDEAERSSKTSSYPVTTNRRSVQAGDLNTIGFVIGPQFAVSRSAVQATVEAGGAAKLETVTLTNITTGEAVPFTLGVDGSPAWLRVSANSATTPATLTFSFSANGVATGDYTTTVRIDSTANVVNKPLLIKAVIKVTAALFAVEPAGVAFSYDCANPGVLPTKSISINGTPGVKYSAAILASPTLAAASAALNGPVYNAYVATDGDLVLRNGEDQEVAVGLSALVTASAQDAPSEIAWLKANPMTSTVPSNITLTATPLISTTAKFAEALLLVVADARAGAAPGNIRVTTVSIVCASSISYLPLISR